jgi:hypothetical protein
VGVYDGEENKMNTDMIIETLKLAEETIIDDEELIENDRGSARSRERLEEVHAWPESIYKIREAIAFLSASSETTPEGREELAAGLARTLRDIRDNWDCDEDAHKHGTTCRCCQATDALLHYDKALLARAPRPEASGEVEALREALTPSGETKAAYIGEFKFRVHAYDEDGNEKWWDEDVPWTTIKEIMAAISKRAAIDSPLKETAHD